MPSKVITEQQHTAHKHDGNENEKATQDSSFANGCLLNQESPITDGIQLTSIHSSSPRHRDLRLQDHCSHPPDCQQAKSPTN